MTSGLRIGICATAGDDGRSGIARYYRQLLPRLTRLAVSAGARVHVYCGPNERAFLGSALAGVTLRQHHRAFASPLASLFWHQTLLPLWAARDGLDVLFMPAGNRRMVTAAPCPVVTTVHDLAHFHLPGKYDNVRTLYVTRLLPVLLRRAAGVIAVSESTRRDLEHLAFVPRDRVRVIHNGVDHRRFAPRKRKEAHARVTAALGLEAPYVLYLSRIEHPGKNHLRLIEAFEALARDMPHHLVLAGADWDGADLVHEAARRSPVSERIHLTGFVDDELVPSLINAASMMIFPSLFEGFGLPVVEALACGTPVAVADRSSLPEVAGDAALRFDPDSPSQMVEAMKRLLANPLLRHKMVERGLSRAKHFCWDGVASQVLEELLKVTRSGQVVRRTDRDLQESPASSREEPGAWTMTG
jgi:glycosyltransferase involved in cell wall biosynthesis